MRTITKYWLALAVFYVVLALFQITPENWVALCGCVNCAWLCLCMAAEKENAKNQ